MITTSASHSRTERLGMRQSGMAGHPTETRTSTGSLVPRPRSAFVACSTEKRGEPGTCWFLT